MKNLKLNLSITCVALMVFGLAPHLSGQNGFSYPHQVNGNQVPARPVADPTTWNGPRQPAPQEVGGFGGNGHASQLYASQPHAQQPYAQQPYAQQPYAEAHPYDSQAPNGHKLMLGMDESRHHRKRQAATWQNEGPIPWEAFAYGEYIGPHRTPHVPEYRVRVDDQIEFIFRLTRELSLEPYRLQVGDSLHISSLAENDQGLDELLQTDVTVMPDGTISLRGIGQVMAARKTIAELQYQLNEAYEGLYTEPRVVVRGTLVNTPLQDLRDAVDARQGTGGQGLTVTVAADGTVQMPMIGSVPAVGLSLSELAREVNMRYRCKIRGIEFTPNVVVRAPRVAYVLGEVTTPGQIALNGPTTVMQAIAQAEGWLQGANVRQIVVFRRDANWRLMALRLDLGSTLAGKNPLPADDIWLRHGDVVLIPKSPIQRISELVDMYLTRTIYSVVPQDGIGTIFDSDSFFNGNIGN